MNRKGMSIVISALLLIALAVAASVLLYVYSIGLIDQLETHGGTQIKEQLALEVYDWSAVSSLRVTFRNVGSNPILIASIYLNSVIQQGTGYAIPVGATLTTTIVPTGMYTVGQAYTLKVASADGAVFVFQVVCGESA